MKRTHTVIDFSWKKVCNNLLSNSNSLLKMTMFTVTLRGYCTPNLKWACSQNYQHFLKNNACILKKIIQGTQNGIGI